MVPLPDQYRGQHHYSDEEASVKYAAAVKSQIAKLEAEGRKLAAFISEPYFVESGVHPTTSQYYQQVYRYGSTVAITFGISTYVSHLLVYLPMLGGGW